MSSPLDHTEQPTEPFTLFDLIKRIWFHPVEVISFIVEFNYHKHRWGLLVFQLFVALLSSVHLGLYFNDGATFLLYFLEKLGIKLALILIPVLLLTGICKLLDGKARLNMIFTIFIWIQLPFTAFQFLQFIYPILLEGLSDIISSSLAETISLIIDKVILYAVYAWCFVLAVLAIAIANQFNGWKAFGAMIFTLLLTVLFIYIGWGWYQMKFA